MGFIQSKIPEIFRPGLFFRKKIRMKNFWNSYRYIDVRPGVLLIWALYGPKANLVKFFYPNKDNIAKK